MKARQVLSITLTLFAVFFGAGNMIFPPAMGQQAGEHYIQALAGFIVTDAGIALLGMIAVVLVGTEVSDLGELVGRRFAIFLSVCIYLLIGPLFALPRTGSVTCSAPVSDRAECMVGIFDRDRNFFRTDLLSERESEKGGESDRKIPHSGAFDLYCPDFSGMCFNGKITAWPGSVWQHRCPSGSICRNSVLSGND